MKNDLIRHGRMMDEPKRIECGREAITMGDIVIQDGIAYIRTEAYVDFGKAGTAHAVVLDPCITKEAQQRRREDMVRKCQDLIRRGLM